MTYRHRLLGLGFLVALAAGYPAVMASAQEVPIDPGSGSECGDASSSESPSETTSISVNCAKEQHNRVALFQVQEAIEDVVAGRLLGDRSCGPGGCPEPAGLRFADSAEAQRYLMQKGGITISPAADVVAATPTRLWNTWVDGKFTWSESGDDDINPTEGPLVNITAGIDYKITDRFIVGILGSYESSDLDTDGLFPADTETEGWGGGAYVGVTLTDHIVFSGVVTGVVLETDADNAGVTSNLDSDRLQASGGVTGYWYSGQWRFSPSLTAAWSKEWQDEYTDSSGAFGAEQTFETAIITGGGVIGYTHTLKDGTTIEPWAGAMLDWTFVNTITTEGFDDIKEDDTVDLRLQTGFNWNLAENAQLALTGEIAGLLLDESDSYSGAVNFAVQF